MRWAAAMAEARSVPVAKLGEMQARATVAPAPGAQAVCQVRAPVTPTLVPRVQVAVRRATRAAFLSSAPVQEARTSSRSLRWSVPSAGSGVAAISAWREDGDSRKSATDLRNRNL